MRNRPLKRAKSSRPRSTRRWSVLPRLAAATASVLATGALIEVLHHPLLREAGAGWSLAVSGGLVVGAFRIAASGSLVEALGWRRGDAVTSFEQKARACKDLTQLANLAVASLQQQFRPKHLFMWLPPTGDPSFHLVAGLGPFPSTYVIPEFSVRQLLRERPEGAWVLHDPADAPPAPVEQLLIQVGASVCLPIVHQGQLIGLVTLGRRVNNRAYGTRELAGMSRWAQAIAEALVPHQLRAEQAHHLSKLEAVSRLYVDAQKRAVTDGLTGLTTHLHFQEQLAKRFYESRRFGQPLSLVLLDVDHFKRINDTFGHLMGDEVLREISRTVQDQARACDTVARYGGEEIAMILPQTDLDGACILAERLREAVGNLTFREGTGERSFDVTVSVGVAQLVAADQNGEDLVDRADKALYQAKRRGRNRVMQLA
ncbi:MAG: sensor domain-containing diguanylate cyclase [bacterium]|nr:sensor domain-containing diguanylate cyclase [bacterium]